MDPVIIFVKQLLERAVKTAAQFSLAAVGGEQVFLHAGFQWQHLAYAAGSGFILSMLTSVASVPLGEPGSPSLVKTVSQAAAVSVPDTSPEAVTASTDAVSAAQAIFPREASL